VPRAVSRRPDVRANAKGIMTPLLRSMWGVVGPGISTALESAAELIVPHPGGVNACLHPPIITARWTSRSHYTAGWLTIASLSK
jgi:hypothetical protein